jgi:hypothetical protein
LLRPRLLPTATARLDQGAHYKQGVYFVFSFYPTIYIFLCLIFYGNSIIFIQKIKAVFFTSQERLHEHILVTYGYFQNLRHSQVPISLVLQRYLALDYSSFKIRSTNLEIRNKAKFKTQMTKTGISTSTFCFEHSTFRAFDSVSDFEFNCLSQNRLYRSTSCHVS